jgi:hypothetical protein
MSLPPKKLSDGSIVPSECYWFLMEWNEKDCNKSMRQLTYKNSLFSLNIDEFVKLFDVALKEELHKLIILETSLKSNQNDKYDNICFELDTA